MIILGLLPYISIVYRQSNYSIYPFFMTINAYERCAWNRTGGTGRATEGTTHILCCAQSRRYMYLAKWSWRSTEHRDHPDEFVLDICSGLHGWSAKSFRSICFREALLDFLRSSLIFCSVRPELKMRLLRKMRATRGISVENCRGVWYDNHGMAIEY